MAAQKLDASDMTLLINCMELQRASYERAKSDAIRKNDPDLIAVYDAKLARLAALRLKVEGGLL